MAPPRGPEETKPAELRDVLDATSAVGERLSQLGDGAAVDADALLQELAEAQHDLQLVVEKMQAGHSDIAAIIDGQRADHWWQRKLIATLPMPVLETDTTGRIVWANSSAAAVLNRQVLHLVRTTIQRFVHIEDHAMVEDLLVSMRSFGEGRTRMESDVRMNADIGGTFHVELVLAARRDDDRMLITWVLNPLEEEASDIDSAVIARTFSELCLLPLRSGSLQDLLSEVAQLAEDVCATRSSVSVSIGPPAEPLHIASSTVFAQRVDAAQMAANEGPCQEAWESDSIIYSNDALRDPRWTAFGAEAADTGVASALAAPIRVGDDLLGVLNVYSRDLTAFRPGGMRVIELLAEAIGAVVHHVGEETQLRELTSQLEEAMASRQVIEQAKGVLIAQYGCTADDAFARLVRVSQNRNTKVRDIAIALIASVTDERRS